MSRRNDLDSIARRVGASNELATAFDRVGTQDGRSRAVPRAPGPSKCVVEEICEEMNEEIGAEPGACESTPEIKEQRESSTSFRKDVQAPAERVEYSDGSVYLGEVVVLDGKVMRHGQGTYEDASRNATYTGSFRYDVVEGRAKAVMADGSVYEGAWVAGQPEGEGRATYPKGGEFRGEFEAGMRSGWGVMSFEGGDVYEGFWSNDKIHGTGRWTHADGSYYQGTFEAGSRVQGKLISSEGEEMYDGEWRGEARHGRGRAKLGRAGGAGMYDGQWSDNVPHGEGTMRYLGGAEYEGAFVEGKRHGQGTIKFGNGDTYAGGWVDDAMHGKGYLVEDGSRYAGEFVDGKRHGQGTMRFADGSVYCGEFVDGRPHGEGTMKFADGSVYRGEFVEGRRHGYGKCKFEDGTTFKGAWDDDGWVQTAADPGRSKVAGPGIVRAEAGRKAAFLIQARDVAGNRRLSGGDDFQVTLVRHGEGDGPGVSSCEITDKEDGTYEVTYVANVAGVYELSVLCRDEHVADSPYPVRVLPGPAVFSKTLVSGVKTIVRPEETMEFEIRARDRFGNLCSTFCSSELEVLLGTERVDEVVRAGDGRVVVRIKIDKCGRHVLRVLMGGRDVPGTPFSLSVEERGGGGNEEGRDGEGRGGYKWASFSLKEVDSEDSGDDEDDEGDEGDEGRMASNGVPVVENLEDLWLVSKLQQERKAREEGEKKKRIDEMRRGLESTYKTADEATRGAMADEIREVMADEMRREAMAETTADDRNISRTTINLSSLARVLDDV